MTQQDRIKPLLAELNPEQARAAMAGVQAGAVAEPLLIIAGAGTGKTNTLAFRVAMLLLHGVRPERIALLTFSRRAAREMQRRAERIVARCRQCGVANVAAAATQQLSSGTFHAVGSRLLREFAPNLGLRPDFSILDRGDAADLIDMVRHELGLAVAKRRFPRKDTCLSLYSYTVNSGMELEAAIATEYAWCAGWEEELRRLFGAYVEAKQARQLLDYDDLLLYWHLMMQEPALARAVGDRFDHVLVDEYQDTNRLQADILHALKPDGRGLCVVGDDAQSIYSFRAATVDNILGFPERFSPPAQRVLLERNYRSVQPVLDAANALMGEAARGFRKVLRGVSPGGEKPRYVMIEDDRSQAEYVVERVLARREEGVALREQAVLMRKAHDSDLLEVELSRRDIPYVKYGGLKFLEAAHVKDLLAILRFAGNPMHRLAGFRCLQLLCGVGPALAARGLDAIEQRGGSLSALWDVPLPAPVRESWQPLLELLLSLAGDRPWPGQVMRVRSWYEPQLERLYGNANARAGDLAQLEALAAHHGDRESFLTELTLEPPEASGEESGDPHRDDDYLILSTVHSAKGQEWDSTYVLNVVDGNFPSEFATDRPERLEEERRLLYVAMTRARRHLDLLAPLRFYVTEQRRFGERHVYGARSRFLSEAVLACFEQRAYPERGPEAGGRAAAMPALQIDAGARLRSRWGGRAGEPEPGA